MSMMKAIPDQLTPEQAWERLALCKRMPVEEKLLSEALDHCIAENFAAVEDVPAGNRSFMDGYAVRAEDTSRIPAHLKVVCEVAMGEIPAQQIGSGEAASIPTGGFLPAGADAVVMQEDTEEAKGSVLIRRSVAPGENVQVRGEDFRRGDLLFSAPHRLRSQDLSSIATFGVSRVRVYRRPELCILSTGNELIPFEVSGTKVGKIRETNSLALISFLLPFAGNHSR
jgi:molybdopterin molybdotransferase